MIRQQNYIKVAQYTQKAFQIFCKRVLASRILQILDRNKLKRQINPIESQIPHDSDILSSDFGNDKKNMIDDNDSVIKGMTYTKQVNSFQRDITSIRISTLYYQDFVFFEVQGKNNNYRICSVLNVLKMFNCGHSEENIVNLRRTCFELCSPTNFRKKKEKILTSSMVCLKNVFTGHYLHLTEDISSFSQFGYKVELKPQISKSSIFKLSQNDEYVKQVSTDQDICITSYYHRNLNISVTEEHMEEKVDRTIFGSYQFFTFKVIKVEQTQNLCGNTYFFINCVGINQNVATEQPHISRLMIKRQYNKIAFEHESQNGQKNQTQQFSSLRKYYSLSETKLKTKILISPPNSQSISQVWQICKLTENIQTRYRIKSIINSQPLHINDAYDIPNSKRRITLFQFKNTQNNGQLTIINDDGVTMAAMYDRDGQQYVLKFESDFNNQSDNLMGKNNSCRFQMVQFQPGKTELLYKLVELNDLLRYNYSFFQKWGFKLEERDFRLRYSVCELKKKLNLLRGKIKQVNTVVQRLKQILNHEQNNLCCIQQMVKQLKLLQLLIYYCRIIKLKIGSNDPNQIGINHQLAKQQMKPTLLLIFELLHSLIRDNKICSQVIIENSKFFSFLLLRYPEPIGLLVEEAIKNICLLNNRAEEADDIINWTNLIEPLTKDSVNIQKKYVDIIAEVVVDPNDFGISSYQSKIKQQLFNHRTKKKVMPKFAIQTTKTYSQPMIIFEYAFPIFIGESNNLNTVFELRNLFKNRKAIPEYASYVGYISSLIKLLRNLCKDRNRKLPKIIQDYGLTQNYMNAIFKNGDIGWSLIARFLQLYCSIHIVQDPFLSFDKRQVKCYSWQKINNFDFSIKTSLLFNQFTQQNTAIQKLKLFDNHILPLLDRYFQQLLNEHQEDCEKQHSFLIIINILYEIINYGYLSHRYIQKYVRCILSYIDVFLRKQNKQERKDKLILKIIDITTLTQQIWTTIQGMNLLKILYNNLKQSKPTSVQYLKQIFLKALNHDQQILQTKKYRRPSINIRSSKRLDRMNQNERMSIVSGHLQLDSSIIQFTITRISQNRLAVNSSCLNKLLTLLQLISSRGERLCNFLQEIFILNNQQEQKLYIQYSGIGQMCLNSDSQSSSRRLQNVMKVKELVDRIISQNGQADDSQRKKQKINQLNNLLMKIIANLSSLKQKHHQLFRSCQILLQKLKLHSILIQILRYYQHQDYQQLISKVIQFYIQFTQDNHQNQTIVAHYFQHFTKRYSFQKLPYLLPILFKHTQQPEQCFWMVYRNMDRQMDNNNRDIMFQCIYRIIQIAPAALIDKIKGQIIYTLTGNAQFDQYIKGSKCSPSFVRLLCLIGEGSTLVSQKIRQQITKSELLQKLKEKKGSYFSKWVYLRLYHFLYIQNQQQIEQIECEFVIQKIVLQQLKRLPASCHSRASHRLQQLQADKSTSGEEREIAMNQIEHIISQYGNLMMQGSQTVTVSEEQSYFIYLLNIQNQKQLSLLVFLEKIMQKYTLTNIEPLANYVFKIINFMERIFFKDQKAYQSRILNKLYQISVILQQKYNRSPFSTASISYIQAYPKVQSFFKKLSQIVQKQNISYTQLLNCAQIKSVDVEQYRQQVRVSKLVLQSDFFKFMQEVEKLVNNRGEYNAIASQNNLKQFFSLYKQKSSLKLNIISFISKLVQTLQFQKNSRLFKIFSDSIRNEQARQRQLKIQDKTNCEQINCQLLKADISSLNQTYQLHQKQYMFLQIKKRLEGLMQQVQRNALPEWRSINYHSILQIHQKSQHFSIIHLIVFQTFKNIRLSKTLQNINKRVWENYFKFICRHIVMYPNAIIIDIILQIYEQVNQNKIMFQLFFAFFKLLMRNVYELIKNQKQSDPKTFAIMQKTAVLATKIIQNPYLTAQMCHQIQQNMAFDLMNSFAEYVSNYSVYWYMVCQTILGRTIVCFQNYYKLPSVFASSKQFIGNLTSFMKTLLKEGVMNTNCSFQNRNNLALIMLKLIKKLRVNGFQNQVANIIAGWPFQFIFQTVQNNYSFLMDNKHKQGLCELSPQCSFQFCNRNKMTPFDQETVHLLINLLIIVQIASEFINLPIFQAQCSSENRQILTIFAKWKSGIYLKGQNDGSRLCFYLNLIKDIQVNMDNSKKKFYFNISYLERYRNKKIEEQIIEQLSLFKQQNYFENLYFLSVHIQQKLKDYIMVEQGYVTKHYITKLDYIHAFTVTFLCLVCINRVFAYISVPNFILHTFNIIVIFIKLSVFSFDIRRFITEYKAINQIKYIEYMKVKKYIRLIMSFVQILCFLLLFSYQFFYPIAFLLQIIKISAVERVISILIKSSTALLYPLIFYQAILIIISYNIYTQQKGVNALVYIYITLMKQVSLYSSITMHTDHIYQFQMLKKVPLFIPFVYLFGLGLQIIFMGQTYLQFIKLTDRDHYSSKTCPICSRSKDYFEQKGLSFRHHVQNQHNVWNYIFYFIYLRNNKEPESYDLTAKTLIQKQDFRFLTIRTN